MHPSAIKVALDLDGRDGFVVGDIDATGWQTEPALTRLRLYIVWDRGWVIFPALIN